MPKLRKYLSPKRFAEEIREPVLLPVWWAPVRTILAIVIGITLLVQFATSGGAGSGDPFQAAPPATSPPVVVPDDADAFDEGEDSGLDEVEADDDPVPPSSDGFGRAELPDGSIVAVPVEAHRAAAAVAEALFTGDFDAVPLAAGVRAPQLPSTWPSADVGGARVDSVESVSEDQAVIVFPVTLSTGEVRTIAVEVVRDGVSWVWEG